MGENLKKYCVAIVTLAIIGLSGCSTTPVVKSQASLVTPDQVLNPEIQKPSADRTIPVLLIRDAGFMGSFIDAIVAVDGTKIVKLKPEQRFEFYLSAGSHVFSVIPASNPLGEAMGENDIEIRPAGNNSFRLRLIYGDGPRIERSSQIDK